MWTQKWNLTLDPCVDPAWYGLTCNSNGSSIVDLSLGSNGLSGTLPDLDLPELSRL